MDNTEEKLIAVWQALQVLTSIVRKLKERSQDLEERIRCLEGDPLSPPATSDDFE